MSRVGLGWRHGRVRGHESKITYHPVTAHMEASSVANQDEAMKCRDIGLVALDDKNYDKALKFFKKSSQMFPLDGINELIKKVEILKTKQDQGDNNFPSSDGTLPKASSTDSKTNERYSASAGTETPKSSGGSSKASSGNSTPKATSSSSSSSSSFNSKKSNSNSNSNTTSNSSSTRGYTDEQEAGAKRILAQSKKSHYECLGVSKTATEDEIKKAYKKLALKFHPDKNSAPSAEGAFKAINSAVECLSDASKREIYDQYGTDNPQNMTGGGFPGGGFHFPQGGFRGQGVHEINPEEIFNLFFQGGMGGPGFRTNFRTFPQQRGRQFNQQERRDDVNRGNTGNSSMIQQILQFLPMILLFLMMGNFGGSNQQSVRPFTFSQNPTYGYKHEIRTPNGATVYANDDFYSDYSRRKRKETHYTIFKEIDRQYLTYLSEQCVMNPKLCAKKEDFICAMNPDCRKSKKGSSQNGGGSTYDNPSHSKRSDQESEF